MSAARTQARKETRNGSAMSDAMNDRGTFPSRPLTLIPRSELTCGGTVSTLRNSTYTNTGSASRSTAVNALVPLWNVAPVEPWLAVQQKVGQQPSTSRFPAVWSGRHLSSIISDDGQRRRFVSLLPPALAPHVDPLVRSHVARSRSTATTPPKLDRRRSKPLHPIWSNGLLVSSINGRSKSTRVHLLHVDSQREHWVPTPFCFQPSVTPASRVDRRSTGRGRETGRDTGGDVQRRSRRQATSRRL